MIQKTLTIFNIVEPQTEQAEENPFVTYKCRPKTKSCSPYDRLGGV